ncbi:unnamed protein product [Cladocopium goreaui]|uniref:Protein NLRC3 n=1 Tax=Cladocopium goreaui TaxID=2562237 RepID=A0A9P1FHF6_9DINO|nr:unnamed protein product [Cladocopium goreaui]
MVFHRLASEAAFARRTGFASIDDLRQLEEKLLEPAQESVSEEADARAQATANETLPRIEGDQLSLSGEPTRGEATQVIKSCLQSSLALKQALQDESIDPYEMKSILKSLGHCSEGGSQMIQKLFVQEESPFSFHGQLPGDSNKKILTMKPWEDANSACTSLSEKAESVGSTPSEAAHLMTEAGHCLAKLGKAMVSTPLRLGSAPLVMAMPLQEHAWKRRQRRQCYEFL